MCRQDIFLLQRLQSKLNHRTMNGTLRSITPYDEPNSNTNRLFYYNQKNMLPVSVKRSETIRNRTGTIDFSSNDYFGLAQCHKQLEKVKLSMEKYLLENKNNSNCSLLGSTGSRLLSGNSSLTRKIEYQLAGIYNKDSALLINSGYDANLCLLSSIPLEGDVIIMDELIHNSFIMGSKMGRIDHHQSLNYFQHNNVFDLELQLKKNVNKSSQREGNQIFIVVESVYSMNGDIAPLQDILSLASKYGALVIVDEAHGLGVYGTSNVMDLTLAGDQSTNMLKINRNNYSNIYKNVKKKLCLGGEGVLVALGLDSHPSLFACTYTFGKAAGCHGAVIVSSKVVVNYLVNYAQPFIYSTALSPHSLLSIQCAYHTLFSSWEGELRRRKIFELVRFFRTTMIDVLHSYFYHDCENRNKSYTSEEIRQLVCSKLSSVLLPSPSPIQGVLCTGNDRCIQLANELETNGSFSVFAIRSPAVPRGSERVRIIFHAHNHKDEVKSLVCLLVPALKKLAVI